MKYPTPIVAAMAQIVADVSTDVLPILQEANSNITGVRFDYGHWLELQETLNTKDNSPKKVTKQSKYPVIFLLEDIPIDRGVNGFYGIANMTLLIAVDTKNTYKSKERQELKFDPIIDPIYNALMERLKIQPYYLFDGDTPPHRITDRKYMGRVSLAGNTANSAIDFIDAKEITNLRMSIDYDSCLTAINIFETT